MSRFQNGISPPESVMKNSNKLYAKGMKYNDSITRVKVTEFYFTLLKTDNGMDFFAIYGGSY